MVITVHPPQSWLDEMVCSKCGKKATPSDWAEWLMRHAYFENRTTWLCTDCQKDGEK